MWCGRASSVHIHLRKRPTAKGAAREGAATRHARPLIPCLHMAMRACRVTVLRGEPSGFLNAAVKNLSLPLPSKRMPRSVNATFWAPLAI